jgi:hypothetical protein
MQTSTEEAEGRFGNVLRSALGVFPLNVYAFTNSSSSLDLCRPAALIDSLIMHGCLRRSQPPLQRCGWIHKMPCSITVLAHFACPTASKKYLVLALVIPTHGRIRSTDLSYVMYGGVPTG